MKKIFVDNKWKIDWFRKKKFQHELKRKKQRIKNWRYHRFEKVLLSRESRNNTSWASQDLRSLKNKILTIECPDNYSFIFNTDDFINHINEAKKLWNGGCVHFNFKNVKYLSFDALCLLLASTKDDRKIFKHGVKWNLPIDKDIRKFMLKSWFLKNFEWSLWDMQHVITKKRRDSKTSEKITKIIKKHTFSDDKLKTKQAHIHPFLVEAMKNTDDHAWEWYRWWIFHYKDNNKVTKVCFLDLWEWILKTICNQYDDVFWLFKLWTRIDTMKNLFENKIESAKRRTKTEEEKRWTWLPLIYKFLTSDNIKNAYVITNNVKVDISTQKYTYLNTEFHWTFYYWEITP